MRFFLLRFIFFAVCAGYSFILTGTNVIYTTEDSLIFVEYTRRFANKKDLPSGGLLSETALFFVGKPYVASTLEQGENEKLTVNLREFDCMTFIESCLALVQVIQSEDLSFDNYCTILRRIRYRNGIIEDYSSRLHYVSDWKFENQKNGFFSDITDKLGGKPVKKTINFMSAHPKSYKQISKSEEIENKIKKIEVELNKKGDYSVLNKKRIPSAGKDMQNGDIAAFSTNMAGLDFTHIGIIYTNEKQMTFIHASTNRKEVTIERKSLADYCDDSTKCDGIMVLRLK